MSGVGRTAVLIGSAFLSLMVTGCAVGPTVRGIGSVEGEDRTVPSFRRVELAGDGEVTITRGSPQAVHVEAQRSILDVLRTEVRGETLHIDFGNVNVGPHEPVKVRLTMPALKGAALPGSGSIRSDATWGGDALNVDVSGSGSVSLKLAAVADLTADISGSGEVTLSGDAERARLGISGSGHIAAAELHVQEAAVAISGSGSVDADVVRKLSAHISGSGSVRYRGTPEVKSRITGSGSVSPAK